MFKLTIDWPDLTPSTMVTGDAAEIMRALDGVTHQLSEGKHDPYSAPVIIEIHDAS
jgi:hypothetical protein